MITKGFTLDDLSIELINIDDTQWIKIMAGESEVILSLDQAENLKYLLKVAIAEACGRRIREIS